jgi:hypothetical protein
MSASIGEGPSCAKPDSGNNSKNMASVLFMISLPVARHHREHAAPAMEEQATVIPIAASARLAKRQIDALRAQQRMHTRLERRVTKRNLAQATPAIPCSRRSMAS